MNQLVIAIPFVITFVYALYLPNVYNNVIGDNNSGSYISQGIFLTNAIPTTTTVQQDRESDENEPITDLPVIDSPCKSPCPPSAEMCIYMCK